MWAAHKATSPRVGPVPRPASERASLPPAHPAFPSLSLSPVPPFSTTKKHRMSLPEADVEKIAAVPKAGSYKEEGIVTHHTDGTVHRSVSASWPAA